MKLVNHIKYFQMIVTGINQLILTLGKKWGHAIEGGIDWKMSRFSRTLSSIKRK